MNNEIKVWVIDDDRSIRWVLEKALKQEGMNVQSFETADKALQLLAREEPDVLVTDIRMPGMSGLELLQAISEQRPALPVIIMTAHSDLDSAVSAYQGGAFEYLPKPFDVDEAVELVRRAVAHRREQTPGPAEESRLESMEIIGEAPSMQEVFRAIGRLSSSNITVLINGESGTGKELVAHALHKHSPRRDKPFIALNTAAIPRDLLESELFGHERGAFTGAQSAREGRFEQADGGTLFLDEIGDMPAELQTRLLRVLADGQFYRVGGRSPIKVDVRVIAATHQHLEQRVQEGLFREDLFHRLNVIRIHIPALRERGEDIPLLMQHFLKKASEEIGVETKWLDKATEIYLSSLEWPGNVRQLENTCRWLTVMSPGQEIHLEDLPPELKRATEKYSDDRDWLTPLRRWAEQKLNSGASGLLEEALPQFERLMIEVALKKSGGHRQEAAQLLGWGRNTITRKIKELGMEETG
ncbi:MAG: nitrogen regulation protein NR(I) [Gammaproteobacteria bacterium]|nr:nitrogen regulation protein NR(I) [Gammaproteobacteria bacterium]MCW8841331.1 nitrogen regulation protein NR(I) [Gammaproteobacteria bacterium]MCW8959423.1 nitrogen regulation protein NR(I) [Gammaproteobacteria bacterium]MCW8971965.1 nitrogen regulation protein NR(I) [Gammaproteobacteria bacterium]MCW8991995.1 nitrogen regulation protein NR(I) [Gammaproteobacteria bacterium]